MNLPAVGASNIAFQRICARSRSGRSAVGAFNILRSETLAWIGLPGVGLGFLIPKSLDSETFSLIAIPLVWGGSFAIWCALAYGAISLAVRLRQRIG